MLGGFLLHIVTYQWVCSLYTLRIALFQDCLISDAQSSRAYLSQGILYTLH